MSLVGTVEEEFTTEAQYGIVQQKSCGPELALSPVSAAEPRQEPSNNLGAPFVDVSAVTEYGMTQRLSRALRVF
jgi:hypothetical protein